MGLFDFIRTKPRTGKPSDAAPPELIKPRDATLPELEEQLAEARRARDEAEREVQAAQEAFDDLGSPAAAVALAEAKATAQTADAYVGRAERLLEHARDQAVAAERARLEAERDELVAMASPSAVSAAVEPIAREEALALLRVAELRARRIEIADEHSATVGRLRAVLRALGEEGPSGIHVDERGRAWTSGGVSSHESLCRSPSITKEALEELLRERKADARIRALLRHLKPTHESYQAHVHPFAG